MDFIFLRTDSVFNPSPPVQQYIECWLTSNATGTYHKFLILLRGVKQLSINSYFFLSSFSWYLRFTWLVIFLKTLIFAFYMCPKTSALFIPNFLKTSLLLFYILRATLHNNCKKTRKIWSRMRICPVRAVYLNMGGWETL